MEKVSGSVKIFVIITAANIIGKVLGFGKDVMVSYFYGTGAVSDAFFLSFSIPTMILGVFTSSTDSAIIPQYKRISFSNGRKSADLLFSKIVNLLGFIGLICSFGMLLFPKPVIHVFAPGFSGQQFIYACFFLRIFSFAGFLHILFCFFCTYNIIYERVIARAVLSFTTNLFVIIAMIFWHDENMIAISCAFMLGNILAAVLPVAVAIKLGYRHKFAVKNFWDEELKQFVKIFFPIMIVAFISDLNQFVDKFLASNIEGGISTLNYAFRLTAIFDSMLVVGVSAVLLPKLSELNIKGDSKHFAAVSSKTIKYLSFTLLPLVSVSMVLSEEIIRLIYYRGEFNAESLQLVSQVFFCYAPLLFLTPLQTVLAKIFHSVEDTRTPMLNSCINIFLNIGISIVLFHFIGISGVAIGTTFSTAVSCGIMLFLIKKRFGWSRDEFGWTDIFKIILVNGMLIAGLLILRS